MAIVNNALIYFVGEGEDNSGICTRSFRKCNHIQEFYLTADQLIKILGKVRQNLPNISKIVHHQNLIRTKACVLLIPQ